MTSIFSRHVTPVPLADFHCFSNRETSNTRLGPSKIPQPSIDLIYIMTQMAARSVSTAEFEVPTLSCRVLVWNGGVGVMVAI